MTTIAWDGHVLAVDSQSTSGDSVARHHSKLLKMKDGWFTGCGTVEHIHMIRAYVNGELEKLPDELDATGFHVTKNFLHRYDSSFPVSFPNFKRLKIAMGTGWEWAQAAMDHGSNAIQAVEYACKKDVYTGGKVYWVEIIPRRKPRE